MSESKTRSFSTRLTAGERKSIAAAARLQGCTPSSFIRGAAVAQARMVSWDPEEFALKRVRQIMKELADKG